MSYWIKDLATGQPRRDEAYRRKDAAKNVSTRLPLLDASKSINGEEDVYNARFPTNFTKGLAHDQYGLVDPDQYKRFVKALTTAIPDMDGLNIAAAPDERKWESPLAGHYFTAEGPDPDAVAMAPPPKIGRSELCAEMATVYAMAITRDLSFAELSNPESVIDGLSWPDGTNKAVTVGDVLAELKKLSWFDKTKSPIGAKGSYLTMHETRRRAAAWDSNDELTIETLFRGSTKGAKIGPYISQFMLLGTKGRPGKQDPKDGLIEFGLQNITQSQWVAKPYKNFMTTWDEWLEVQRGKKTNSQEGYEDQKRRIVTLRDLASYVHFDALYQAYLNACLIMLGNGVATDPGNPIVDNRDKNSEGFATFGGPHILSLLTEVATRGLRAVRRAKFQVHRRARPEVLAARLAQVAAGHTGAMDPPAIKRLQSMLTELGADDLKDGSRPGALMHWVSETNEKTGKPVEAPLTKETNFLLPMAFSEGSPMHPAYGAGHATVAGACVTILKAFFDSNRSFKEAIAGADKLYVADKNNRLNPTLDADPTIAEELDKLAANISIGRNMAGVHYYSDYYDSVRLGERIAVGILEEQMLTYSEPTSFTFTSFDGEQMTVMGDGTGNASGVSVLVNGTNTAYADWWTKDLKEYGIVVADLALA